MIISCNTIVDRRDHVQYLTVSKSYSDNCTCSLTEQNTCLFVFVALRPMSTAMVIAGRSVHLTTLFPGQA